MKSPLAYVGGKSKLAPHIVTLIPEHTTYCEVCTGAGWVFFTKPESKCEIINDLDSDLTNFYRVVREHFDEFVKHFRFLLCSREEFENFKQQIEVDGLTDIQRAVRYYYLQRLCFGAKVADRNFGSAVDRRPRINLAMLGEEISATYMRLQRVTVENLDCKKCIQKYDRPATFFYLDPPYYKKPCYKHNFEHQDFEDLSELLKTLKGKFLLSLNDTPEVREIFKGFTIENVTVNYTLASKSQVKAKEVLIRNYDV